MALDGLAGPRRRADADIYSPRGAEWRGAVMALASGGLVRTIAADTGIGADEAPYELVERKGVGHPDTMCDAIAERASRYYARYCLERFGRVAHHWFDKVMLYGGAAHVGYGEGQLVEPYTVVVAGKGAYRVGEHDIPLPDLLFQAAADTLSEVTTGFDAARHLRLDCAVVDHQGAGRGASRYRPASVDDLVEIGAKDLVSNDCNLLHGYAPFSRLERLVHGAEEHVNGREFKAAHPDTGWDVKVFGRRRGDDYHVIVNMPFLAAHITDLDHYWSRKEAVVDALTSFLAQDGGPAPTLLVNPTDRNGRPYLTALGSVADTGDVGVVGRGNRLNGLITPMRAMSIEAPAGKNPLDHTGKLYGVVAHRLAADAHRVAGRPVETHIFTSKEAPLDDPDEVVVKVRGLDENDGELVARLDTLVAEHLGRMTDLTREIILDGVTMW